MKYSSLRYRLENDLVRFLQPEDRVFSSERGIFINRGSSKKIPIENCKQYLYDLEIDNQYEQLPFIVFSLPFSSSGSYQVTVPQEIIHIENSGWVTHFSSSSLDAKSIDNAHTLPDRPNHLDLTSSETREQFIEKVRLAIKHIEVGEISKVVLARQLLVNADIEIDPRLIIAELMDSQPESYIYSIDGYTGASPELLIEKFSKSIRALPMAGTRKRHARVGDDDATIADLQTNSKDLSEHKVVIDDIFSKLSLISDDVSASSVPHVVRLPHVAHLATSVTATTDASKDLISLVQLLHPTPAVAGTPTNRAMELIEEIENFSRGLYGAPVGYVDAKGDGQCAIALRCAEIEGSRAKLFAGVGIVADSDPDREFEETQAKFSVMRDALINIAQ